MLNGYKYSKVSVTLMLHEPHPLSIDVFSLSLAHSWTLAIVC